MSSVAERHGVSLEDYLEGEKHADVKHEYIAGEVFAMAGASESHVTLAGNLFAMLHSHVRGGPCRVYISDMKVRVEAVDAFYYPDVFVTCDAADSRETHVKRNPTLIVEVLSDSTAAFDRGAKFAHYRHLEALQEYVLIEADRAAIDVFRRNAQGSWVLHPFTGGDELELESLDFRCPLDVVYEDLLFPRKATNTEG
ncbi:MAG: Uma2 family endonuclease [Pseudomonadota bacterium]|nr:Uma2 family endonuclease [Pseudomonadota bacterium]